MWRGEKSDEYKRDLKKYGGWRSGGKFQGIKENMTLSSWLEIK